MCCRRMAQASHYPTTSTQRRLRITMGRSPARASASPSASCRKNRPDCAFAKAPPRVAYLGRFTNPDPKTASYFERYDREADKLQTSHPRDVSEAIAWLTAGVAQAGHELQDPFLKGLLKPEQVSFKLLRQFLDGAGSSPSSTPHEEATIYQATRR